MCRGGMRLLFKIMRMNDGSATKRRRRILATSCCLLLLAASAIAAPPELGTQWPAMWQRRDVLVDLRNLPKRYSCDDLWYKFRDVLLRLGADPRMEILPHRCARSAGPAARSPSVRLEFSVPRPLARAAARGADLTVVMRDVEIAPGEPPTIDASDCALVRQMRPALPGKIVAYRLPCRAPTSASRPFTLTVRALIPEPGRAVPTHRSTP
jgi:hypothetical protein